MNLTKTLTLLLSFGISTTSLALPEDRDLPIAIDSEDFSQDNVRGISSYIGNASITQGHLEIRANRIDVEFEGQEVLRITAVGSPATFSDLPEENGESVYAQGNQVVYVIAKKMVHVIGDAKFENDGSEVSAQTIDFDLDAGAAQATGGVRHVIQPPESED